MLNSNLAVYSVNISTFIFVSKPILKGYMPFQVKKKRPIHILLISEVTVGMLTKTDKITNV